MKQCLLLLGCVLFAISCASSQAQDDNLAAVQDRPNIVVIVADDLGWADVGYHDGRIDTPNLDRLARQGVKLERFYTAPLCSPTRAGLMTGRWPIRYGMAESVVTPWRPWALPKNEDTLADMLGRAGYKRRAAIGKWHIGHYQRQYLPTNRGFTYFYGPYNGNLDYFTHVREGELDWHRNHETCRDEGYSTDLFEREAVRFISDSPAGEPFFLYVPFNAPHTPLQAKEADIAKYAGRVTDPKKRIYAAMVDSMDQAIGGILKAIEKRGIAENTVVLFFSDNGGTRYGSNQPLRSGKGTVYEGGIRVPAIIRWPARIPGGSTCNATMGYIDVYPTLKRIAGLNAADPNPLDGLDMLDVIRGKASPPQRDWYSYIAQQKPEQSALTNMPWKLVVRGGNALDLAIDEKGNRKTTHSPPISAELFNLEKDPGEQTNLLSQQPKIAQKLLKSMQSYRRLKIDVPDCFANRKGFVAPKDWVIPEEGVKIPKARN